MLRFVSVSYKIMLCHNERIVTLKGRAPPVPLDPLMLCIQKEYTSTSHTYTTGITSKFSNTMPRGDDSRCWVEHESRNHGHVGQNQICSVTYDR